MNYYSEKESLVIGNSTIGARVDDIIMAGLVVYQNGSREAFEAFCRVVSQDVAVLPKNKLLFIQVLENLLKNALTPA